MAEKPILFNTPMVQAILTGRKTQTRRIIKRKGYEAELQELWRDSAKHEYENLWQIGRKIETMRPANSIGVFSPYGIGDILWVREMWCKLYDLDDNDQIIEGTGKYYYAADNPKFPYTHFVRDDGTHKDYPAWKPSIHMPREAARLFLRVTDVRAERLQDISGKDVFFEGINPQWYNGEAKRWENEQRIAYRKLWDSLYAKRGFGWSANPWVWVYTFERATP